MHDKKIVRNPPEIDWWDMRPGQNGWHIEPTPGGWKVSRTYGADALLNDPE